LRGDLADETVRRYLDRALGDGEWHELEGLWILARAQGVPRAAFERVLDSLELEAAHRGFHEERFVRLAPATSVHPEQEVLVVAELKALADREDERRAT
jgi:hypothetical protein